jgi:mono/diheme cytochrome c family protein
MTSQIKKRAILIGFVGLAVLLMVRPALAQESGAEIWGRTCNKCHRALPVNKYQADEWRAIMVHMALNARLTPAEEDAVTEFLMSVARPVADASTDQSAAVALSVPGQLPDLVSTDPDMARHVIHSDSLVGMEAYKRQCVVCHGAKGNGDGPAATALKPRPSDLTESELVSEMSDVELLEYLSNGKGAMPGFAKILSKQELSALVGVLRDLHTAE